MHKEALKQALKSTCKKFVLPIDFGGHIYVYVFDFFKNFASNKDFNTSNPNNFFGALIAYEFIQKDFTEITQRRNHEKAALSKLRNNFQDELSETTNEITSYIQNSEKAFEDHAAALDKIKEQKVAVFDEWFNKSKEDHEAFKNESHVARQNLEKLYQEKLKLEAPAKYWNKRANTLNREGRFYAIWAAILVFVTALLLFATLALISTDQIEFIFSDYGVAIKWSLVFVAFLSLSVYGIRVLAKLSFSSYHLARDAEEREQLTYTYLALSKDSKVDEKDRHLVLQALFSRSDSGLLNDDASPTMPGSPTNLFPK